MMFSHFQENTLLCSDSVDEHRRGFADDRGRRLCSGLREGEGEDVRSRVQDLSAQDHLDRQKQCRAEGRLVTKKQQLIFIRWGMNSDLRKLKFNWPSFPILTRAFFRRSFLSFHKEDEAKRGELNEFRQSWSMQWGLLLPSLQSRWLRHSGRVPDGRDETFCYTCECKVNSHNNNNNNNSKDLYIGDFSPAIIYHLLEYSFIK